MRHYIYKITNMDDKTYYIGKHTEKDGENFRDYLGSHKWNVPKSHLSKDIVEEVDSREKLDERELFYLNQVIRKDKLCLNKRIQKTGGETFGRKLNKKFCEKCDKETTQVNGNCYSCFTKKSYYENELFKKFKSNYYKKFCEKCNSIQAMRKIKDNDYCERCHRMENKFKLVKNEDGTISLFSSGNLLLEDVRKFKGITKFGNGYKLPEGALNVESYKEITQIKSVIKNENVDCWYSIDLGFDDNLIVTEEHPLVTDKSDFVKVKDLKVGDKLVYKHGKELKTKEILEIRKLERTDNSYDLETESGFFNLSHNIVSRNSRAGAQVPFTSINFGLDTSKEGRMVSKCLMQAQSNGLGNGETPIFPILVFKVKEGINYNPEDKNYDLLKMSFEVTAKRLFPNWIFEDAPFNLVCYDEKHPELSIATMGCVDGNQTITYRVKQRNGDYFYYENVPIKEAFKHITKMERNK